jgi:hypothetical protein
MTIIHFESASVQVRCKTIHLKTKVKFWCPLCEEFVRCDNKIHAVAPEPRRKEWLEKIRKAASGCRRSSG